MRLAFDFSTVRLTEFGVGLDSPDRADFRLVPVDADVQAALREMAEATWDEMFRQDENPPRYDPAEKHAGVEHLHVPLADPLAERMRHLHEANNLPSDGTALSDPHDVYCYFARLTDGQGRRLTALRRAAQFKGILKRRLIRFVTDAMRIIDDNVFKLDTDFDLLIDPSRVHILRPSGFEFTSQLQAAVLAAAPENIRALKRDLAYVDLENVEAYATSHPRAARYLASIRSQATRNVNKSALRKLCKQTGVEITVVKGQIVVPDEQIMGFLEVLDRRRYELELVSGSPERFRATGRQKLDGGTGG